MTSKFDFGSAIPADPPMRPPEKFTKESLLFSKAAETAGFDCSGIPAFAPSAGGLYLSSNIDPPAEEVKSGCRVCQTPNFEITSVYELF